jgi:hypothetical protein
MRTTAAFTVLLVFMAIGLQRPRAAATEVDGTCRTHGPDRNLLLCDDFENTDFLQHWDIGSNSNTWPFADFVRCGDGFGYKDQCAAWSNRLKFDTFWGYWGYDAWRPFVPQNEFYVRWYQFVSDGYVFGTLEDKSVLVHDPTGTITAYVATSRNELPVEPDSGPGKPFVANYQDLDWPDTGGRFTKVNRFQNQGNDITIEPGRWYLFEWYLKMNTPGQSNGVTKLWIDDATQPVVAQTLRLAYDDMRWLRASDAARLFGFVRLTVYDQRCDGTPNRCPPNGPSILNQWQRWDHVAVSKSRIGPIELPDCESAQAVPNVLWPPDDGLVSVRIRGVIDPQRQPLHISIGRVTEQDSGGRQESASARDAHIRGDHVRLRAARDKRGDERTYRIHFAAQNPQGLQCTGTVRVRVPRGANSSRPAR